MTANHQSHHCISRVPIFNHLDSESMNLIANYAQHLKIAKGSFLFEPNHDSNALYIVHTGRIKIFHLLESGKEQLIRILEAGDFTGEWTLFNEQIPHQAFAQATRDSIICKLSKEDMTQLIIQYPEISLKILSEMARRLAQSETQTTQVAIDHIDQRLAHYLYQQLSSGNESTIVQLKMSRKDLASYLGTTPESISRKFKELANQSIIEELSATQIKILDSNRLL